MRIGIRFGEQELRLRDLVELLEPHCEQIVIDGDLGMVVVYNPDEILIDELVNRGIKWEVL